MGLGFIGTGRITTALVEGLCTAQDPPETVLVSPRNAGKAARLATRFSQVEVAASNQAVIDGCDCVFLAVLPQIASSALSELRFRPDLTVVCLIATKSLDEVRKLASPARNVMRGAPLPSVACHLGPILLYPDDPAVCKLLSRVGQPIVVPDERHLNILWALTALIAPFYALVEEVTKWSEAAGVDRRIAGTYAASMFHAVSALAVDVPHGNLSDLLSEATTPGGLNEQALAEIRKEGGYTAVLKALDSVIVRLDKRAHMRNNS